jgi:hypothetical protein
MVQASGRYKAGDSEATEKPCGGAGIQHSTSNIQHPTSNLERGRPVFAALRRGKGRVEMRAGFASIVPEILFKLDACRDRRHARW